MTDSRQYERVPVHILIERGFGRITCFEGALLASVSLQSGLPRHWQVLGLGTYKCSTIGVPCRHRFLWFVCQSVDGKIDFERKLEEVERPCGSSRHPLNLGRVGRKHPGICVTIDPFPSCGYKRASCFVGVNERSSGAPAAESERGGSKFVLRNRKVQRLSLVWILQVNRGPHHTSMDPKVVIYHVECAIANLLECATCLQCLTVFKMGVPQNMFQKVRRRGD